MSLASLIPENASRQSLVVGREILEILLDLHREDAPVEVIRDVARSISIATSSEAKSMDTGAAGVRYLEEKLSGRLDESRLNELRGLLYQFAAQRTLMWKGREAIRFGYLRQASSLRTGSEAAPIEPDDNFIETVDHMLHEVASAEIGGEKPVGSARNALRDEISVFTHDDRVAPRLLELLGLTSEIASFREARHGTGSAPEVRAATCRNEAVRAYDESVHSFDDGDQEGRRRAYSRSSAYHLCPGWSAELSNFGFSSDLQGAVDLAHVRAVLGVRKADGTRPHLTTADLLLGLFLCPDGKAQGVLVELGIDEAGLRTAVDEVRPSGRGSIFTGIMLNEYLCGAARQARSRGADEQVSGEHLLLALVADIRETPATAALAKLGITREQVKQGVNAVSPIARSATVVG